MDIDNHRVHYIPEPRKGKGEMGLVPMVKGAYSLKAGREIEEWVQGAGYRGRKKTVEETLNLERGTFIDDPVESPVFMSFRAKREILVWLPHRS
jgi:hypothetical protein